MAGLLLGSTVVEAGTAAVAGALSSLSLTELAELLVPSNAVLGLALALAGWPIARHRPHGPIGWLLLAGGACWASTAAGIALLACVADAGVADRVGWRVLATVVSASWSLALTVFLPLALLYFPDGRLPGRSWRWAVPFVLAVGAAFFVGGARSGLTADVGVPGLGIGPVPTWFTAAYLLGTMVTYVGVTGALVQRFRRGSDQVRTQTLWVLQALLLVTTVFALDPVLPDSSLTLYVIALLPLAILLAVLRHSVLDIQLVFSRTAAWVLLSGLAVGGYLAAAALLGAAVGRSAGAPVLATLAVAAAFHPVRVAVQRRVDAAVYGAGRDPVRAFAVIGPRLAEVGGDPDGPHDGAGARWDGVLDALRSALRLPSAALVVGGTEIAWSGVAPPELHTTALHHGGRRLGELVVGVRPGQRRLAAGDLAVLDLLAVPLAVAVGATRLAEELAGSREQVIGAREEERRRLRRDLHDGLGPVLTGVGLNAEAARRLVRSDPARSEELICDLRDQTTAAVADLRRLVHQLRPPALDSLGLAGALEEHARVLSQRADGAPLQVSLAATPLGELPAAVEVAAYRIVTEALTNVVRHSCAGSVLVSLATEDTQLHVAVHDDGAVTGAAEGVGLSSIRERTAELGGRCVIRLDRTGGRIDVWLPLVRSPRQAAVDGGVAR